MCTHSYRCFLHRISSTPRVAHSQACCPSLTSSTTRSTIRSCSMPDQSRVSVGCRTLRF
jgi:hypothetical protein